MFERLRKKFASETPQIDVRGLPDLGRCSQQSSSLSKCPSRDIILIFLRSSCPRVGNAMQSGSLVGFSNFRNLPQSDRLDRAGWSLQVQTLENRLVHQRVLVTTGCRVGWPATKSPTRPTGPAAADQNSSSASGPP